MVTIQIEVNLILSGLRILGMKKVLDMEQQHEEVVVSQILVLILISEST
jgi:uncharacterized membrane protein